MYLATNGTECQVYIYIREQNCMCHQDFETIGQKVDVTLNI